MNSRQGLGRLVGDYIEKNIGTACDVMGCSFGGAVALWLALERPELVDHLVLECPAGLQSIDPALRSNPHAFYKALFAHPEKVSYERKPEEIEARNRAMLAHYGAEDGKDPELLENISRLRATAIVHGTEDRIIAAETMRLLKSASRAFLVYVRRTTSSTNPSAWGAGRASWSAPTPSSALRVELPAEVSHSRHDGPTLPVAWQDCTRPRAY